MQHMQFIYRYSRLRTSYQELLTLRAHPPLFFASSWLFCTLFKQGEGAEAKTGYHIFGGETKGGEGSVHMQEHMALHCIEQVNYPQSDYISMLFLGGAVCASHHILHTHVQRQRQVITSLGGNKRGRNTGHCITLCR